jgi:hypothetical protein
LAASFIQSARALVDAVNSPFNGKRRMAFYQSMISKIHSAAEHFGFEIGGVPSPVWRVANTEARNTGAIGGRLLSRNGLQLRDFQNWHR